MGSKLRLWGSAPTPRLNFARPKLRKRAPLSRRGGLWYGSIKCSPNHAKKGKFSLSLVLATVLAETNIFRCTPLGANF